MPLRSHEVGHPSMDDVAMKALTLALGCHGGKDGSVRYQELQDRWVGFSISSSVGSCVSRDSTHSEPDLEIA